MKCPALSTQSSNCFNFTMDEILMEVSFWKKEKLEKTVGEKLHQDFKICIGLANTLLLQRISAVTNKPCINLESKTLLLLYGFASVKIKIAS